MFTHYIPKKGFPPRLVADKYNAVTNFSNHKISLLDLCRKYHVSSVTLSGFLKLELGLEKYNEIISYNKKFHISPAISQEKIPIKLYRTKDDFSKIELETLLNKVKLWKTQEYIVPDFKNLYS